MVIRIRDIAFWSKVRRLWWPKVLLKRKSRFPVYLALLFIITVQWYTNFSRPGMTNEIQRRVSRHRAIISKTQRLRYQLQILAFKFDFREDINAISIRDNNNEQTERPKAFENVGQILNQDQFRQWPVVINVGCSSQNLPFFLESLKEGLADRKGPVICIFAFTCREPARQMNIASINLINDLGTCVKLMWNVSESIPEESLKFRNRHSSIEQLQKPKLQWWNFINGFFRGGIEKGVLFNGILKNFNQDVLFVDSNVILSPDFLEVATYGSKMKSQLLGITQLSLGIWGGHNLINAHPDTFAVRKSREFHALAYGINESNWKVLLKLQEHFLEDLNPAWTESVGDAVTAMESAEFGIRTVVPTLSRYWLMAELPDYFPSPLARPSFPPWLFSPRKMSGNASRTNGVRDSLGFLCSDLHTLNDDSVRNVICYCSFWTWQKTRLHSFPRCYPQGNDDCLDSY